MEGKPQKSKELAKKARKSVAQFLGVAGENQETGSWKRRSVALREQGRLLGKVNQENKTKGQSPGLFGPTKDEGGKKKKKQGMNRPSVFAVAYDDVKDRMQKSKDDKGKRGVGSPSPSSPPTRSPSPAAAEPPSEKILRFIDPMAKDDRERELGKGLVGELLNREYRKSRMVAEIRKNMAGLTTYRPFFTYWVTFVQIVVFIVIISLYGVGPIGVGLRNVTGMTTRFHTSMEPVYYTEEENMWIGPTSRDLIHCGAKFSPCMRKDYNVEKAVEFDRDIERDMACCIYNDGSGCIETTRERCSVLMAQWKKWPDSTTTRTSGSVCGLDPRFCINPPPSQKDAWPDDITKWPVCRTTSDDLANNQHMTCEIIGRPCCVGIQGECLITTDTHCKFLRGNFQPNYTLCSQVSCMEDICGMIAFYTPGVPDQFGRLISSQFIHAGIIQLLITIVYQWFVMRDLEKLIGWFRIAIIYIFSGLVGSLASAIFLPYHVEAGPSGSQFGIAACLFVEVIQNWYILFRPWIALCKLLAILLVLFIIGLLPMIDNYAHLFGFIYGFLLAFGLMPYITFNVEDKRFKIIGVCVCLGLAVVLLIILIIVFYVTQIKSCTACQYFNCVPFTATFCSSMEIKISRNNSWYS